MLKTHQVAPVLKWAGGKRQLLDTLVGLLPGSFGAYCEPFLGGGALMLWLQPEVAFANDVNDELMGVYRVVKSDVEGLIEALREFSNDSQSFYSVRGWDRNPGEYAGLPAVKKAARLLYLNKTCYNGLFRVNSLGEFNVPFGKYRNPAIVNESGLRALSGYLNAASVTLTSTDFEEALGNLSKGDFAYLDPPYDPVSATASFTGYAKGGFTRDDQARLSRVCRELDSRGVKFMLSNSATAFIRDLYSGFHVSIARAKRHVNSDSQKRGEVDELVVRNYLS